MNFPIDYLYRLVDRGGAGLSCDASGVALGSAELARVDLQGGRLRRCEVRSPRALGQILAAAYGPQPDAVVQRLHRGLRRTAAWLDAGDLCHAGVEAVMLRVPDLTPTAVAKLAAFADLEKRGQPWKDEPRVPAGQAGGGQWTTDGGGGRGEATAPASIASPVATVEPTQPADRAPREQPKATLDDGVYHFGADGPRFIPAAIPPEEEPLWSRPGKAPENEYELPYLPAELPGDISAIEDLFPRLESHPFENAPFEFPDQVGVAAYADEIGAPSEALIYAQLRAETKAIDPNYDDLGFFPEGGFASLSQANRADLIDKVLLDRAAAYYKFRDDPSKLQIETLRFLRKTVDKYYAEAVQRSEAGRLPSKIGREVAIGNYVDALTRRDLQLLFDRLRIKYGPGQKALINSRDYDTTQPEKPYRVPDMRIGDVSFDWTLRMKQGTDSQVRGFFAADSRPRGVVIIRPSQLYAHGAYYIPRPPDLYRK